MNASPPDHAATRRSYDLLSAWYDLFSGSEDAMRQKALDCLDPRPGEWILEVGYGTGHCLAQAAALTGDSGLTAGIDLSMGMARAAHRRLARSGTQRGFPATGDALCLPFANRSFDGLLSTFTLELFPQPEISAVLRECRRVLKPGGRMVIAALIQPHAPNRAVDLYTWVHRQLPNLVDCRPIPLEGLVSAAGYNVDRLERLDLWGLPVGILTCHPGTETALSATA